MRLTLGLAAAVARLLAPASGYETTQGALNTSLVVEVSMHGVIDLSRLGDKELRYFDVVEPGYGEDGANVSLVFAGRGGHGAWDPSDETWNLALVENLKTHGDADVERAQRTASRTHLMAELD